MRFISDMLGAVETHLKEAKKWARRGSALFAFHDLAQAEGIVKVLALGVATGTLQLTTHEQIRFMAAASRLDVLLSTLSNGQANPPENTDDEFREVVKYALKTLRDVFS